MSNRERDWDYNIEINERKNIYLDAFLIFFIIWNYNFNHDDDEEQEQE